LADRYGKVTIYIVACLFNIITMLLFLFSFNMPVLIMAVIVYGISRSLSSGSMDAWYVDCHSGLPEEDLRKSLVLQAALAPAVLGLGTLAGGILPVLWGDWFSVHTPFGRYSINILVSLVFILLNVILTTVLFRKDGHSFARSDMKTVHIVKNAVSETFKKKDLRYLLLITALFGLALSSIENLWQPGVKVINPGSPDFILGILSAAYFFAATIGSLVSEKLVDKLGEKPLLLSLKVFMGVFLILLGYQSHMVGFSFFYITFFLLHGMSGAPHQLILNRCIKPGLRASLLSIDSLVFMAGAGIGSLMSGWLTQTHSISLVWLISGTALALSGCLYLFTGSRSEKNEVSI